MSKTCKSPRMVAREALAVGTEALPLYSHECSPKKFTQPQLFACLVLKKFYKTDYRGIAAILADNSDLRQTLGIESVPHVAEKVHLEHLAVPASPLQGQLVAVQ